jgi:Domain of unknown function (DUF222)
MGLTELREAIDSLFDEGVLGCADPESIVALQTEFNRLGGFSTMVAAEFDTEGAWATDGARTAAAWISTKCRLPQGQARRRIREGRALRCLPETAAAVREGSINSEHVRLITRLHQGATQEPLERDEGLLVKQAKKLRFGEFVRVAAYFEQMADPDGADASEEERRSRRDVYLGQSIDGMWLGGMTLDPISGTIVSRVLSRIEREFFEADWAEAKERLGREPKPHELPRTSAQRRADALVEMAIRSETAPADGRRPEPLFSVLVGLPKLLERMCQLEEGGPIAPGALFPWMESAYFERALFTPGTRLEISIQSRLFTGATRRAIELRDRQCTHEFCEEPAVNCQVDHIKMYSHGGLTTQENGRLLCAFHNRLRNQELGADRAPPGP